MMTTAKQPQTRSSQRTPTSTFLAVALATGIVAAYPFTACAQQPEEQAPEPQAAPSQENSHMGEVVSVGEGKLSMTIKGENEHSHDVARALLTKV